MNKSETKKVNVKSSALKFLGETTIHGIPRIFLGSSGFMRLVWLCVSFLSIYATIYTAINTIQDYAGYHVIAQADYKIDIPTIFPALTFCNHYELDLKNLIQTCEFVSIKCNLNDFYSFRGHDFYNHKSYNCLRFNGFFNQSIILKATTGIDFHSGLKISFILPNISNEIFVYVHDNFLNVNNHGAPFYAQRNNRVSFYFEKTIDRPLEYPYNSCLKMKDKSYRQKNCIDACVQQSLANQYNCSIDGYYSLNKQQCKFSFDIEYLRSQCIETCPQECYFINYVSSISNSQLSVEIIKEHSSVFFIEACFASLGFIEVTQIPKYTMFDLVSLLGGSLSLFLGMSFLSIIEIFEFLIEIIYVNFNRILVKSNK